MNTMYNYLLVTEKHSDGNFTYEDLFSITPHHSTNMVIGTNIIYKGYRYKILEVDTVFSDANYGVGDVRIKEINIYVCEV